MPGYEGYKCRGKRVLVLDTGVLEPGYREIIMPGYCEIRDMRIVNPGY